MFDAPAPAGPLFDETVPAADESSSQETPLSLKSGDCYDNVAGNGPTEEPTTVYEIVARDCDEPHQWEVHATYEESRSLDPRPPTIDIEPCDLDPNAPCTDPPPTTEEPSFEGQVRAGCDQRFTTFVGLPPERSALASAAVYDSPNGFSDVVEVRCVVGDPAGPTTGSLRGAVR